MSTLLGIDLGTTALKVSLFEEDGRLLGSASHGYPVVSARSGEAEQDPEDWWRALGLAVQALSAAHPEALRRLVGIGICGQMHTQVYLDGHGRALRPAITWLDQRTGPLVAALDGDPAVRAQVFAHTQNFVTTTYTAPQAAWVRREEPAVWARVRRVLVAKDWLRWRLTGRFATDPSDATGTLLFDVARGRWSEEMFHLFGLSPELFPEVLPSASVAGGLGAEAAAALGLKAGTPVAVGSSDNSASALGAGVVQPGQAALISGTAGVITVCTDAPRPDPQRRTLSWAYCLPGRWITLGIMQTAGESLNWFRRAHDPQAGEGEEIFAEYERLAASVPDAGGVVFLPYLNGERTPHWDPAARGVFFGLSLTTGKAHLVRAVMEGVSMGFRQLAEAVEALGTPVGELRAVGGGLRSRTWLETLARVVRRPVVTVTAPDTGNLGNALLCGKAIGLFPSVEEAAARLAGEGARVHHPGPDPAVERQFAVYAELYQRLQPTFRRTFAT